MCDRGSIDVQALWDKLITAVNAVASIDCAIGQLSNVIGSDNIDIIELKKAAFTVKNGVLAGNYIKIQ